MVVEVFVDDVVRLKKPHPCGSTDWTVTRIGADIGLKCLGCGRRIMLSRPTFEKRLKTFVLRASDAETADQPDPFDTPGN